MIQRQELSSDQLHIYSFELLQGRFLRIDFHSSNLDLLVSMDKPDGKESMEWSVPKRITTPVALAIDVKGTYKLNVRGIEKTETSGTYRIEIKALRPFVAQDQKQIAACMTFMT